MGGNSGGRHNLLLPKAGPVHVPGAILGEPSGKKGNGEFKKVGLRGSYNL